MTLRRAIALTCCAVSAALVGCERAAPAVGDDSGPRLAVLSPAFAETLRELGAGDRIVGRHGWDSFTPGSVPPVGNETDIDYEALLKARPSAVVLQGGAKDPPARLMELASARGWRVERIECLRLDDIAGSVVPLARLAGVGEQRAGAVESGFRAAFAPVAGVAARAGRVLVLAGTEPPGVMGPGSFHFEMVERLGGDAVPDEGAAFIQWGVEDVIRCDPDTLVLMLPGAAGGATDNLGALKRAGLRSVSRGAVVVVSDPKAHLPATSLAGVARRLGEEMARLPAINDGTSPAGAVGAHGAAERGR